MQDFDKVYSKDDWWNLTVAESLALRHQIAEYHNQAVTEEECNILQQADEIESAPYAYARNPFSFQMGKEKEAQELEARQQKILEQAHAIRRRANEAMPENMRISRQNLVLQIRSKNLQTFQ